MEFMTIGEFAHASRLSVKALRHYDELDLLAPAYVDPDSGYRWYAPSQLARARLVAWLRRLGMPLARIRLVCGLEPPSAAEEVAAFWRELEIQAQTRRALAAFLVQYLTREVPDVSPSLTLRYAAHTDRGLVRTENLDAVFAGEGFAAVADGFGQTAASALVSQRAIEAFTSVPGTPGALLDGLHAAALHAVTDVRELASSGNDLADAGTTLTALAWSDDELALVHVGDTRAYLLCENGQLLQLTHDDTLVQSLIDSGQLTEAEAESHPQRATLIRALHGGAASTPPAVLPQYAEPGDRYLLCSDGLHGVLTLAQIHATLSLPQPPATIVDALVALVREAGAPDNVACVVADVLPA